MATYKKLEYNGSKIQVQSAIEDKNGNDITSTYSQASNLENGTGFDSLKQKDVNFTDLNAYIRPYDIAYLVNQGMTQAQAEAIADGPVTQEGSTRYILAGMGITGDLTNIANAMASVAFGANNRVGASSITSAEDLYKGICSAVFGKDLINEGIYTYNSGLGGIYKINASTEAERAYQRKYMDNITACGGSVSGSGDVRETTSGIVKSNISFMNGNKNFMGKGSCNFLNGNQNALQGNNNFIGSGLINSISGASSIGNAIITGDLNKIITSNGCVQHGSGNTIQYAQYAAQFGLGLTNLGKHHRFDIGQFNNDITDALFIVGNGDNENNRSNAFEISTAGDGVLAGKLTLGAAPTANMDATTKQYVDSLVITTINSNY